MTTKFFTCPSCKENARLRTFAPDRVELERERGLTFPVSCPHCHQEVVVHVDQVKARANHLVTYVVTAFCALVWFLIFLFGLYLNIFILLAATSLIGLPVAVRKAVERMATTFNEYKLSD